MTVDVQRLFQLHYLGLVRLAMRLVDDQDTAEDLVQDVFAGLSRRSARVADPYAYLRSAVLNRSRSVLRRRKVARAFWSRHRDEEFTESADGPVLRQAERQRVLRVIARLPRRQREVVVLRYYEDLSVTQVAEVLGVSPGAVSSALNRALIALSPTVEDPS